jgi:hypothetical protein
MVKKIFTLVSCIYFLSAKSQELVIDKTAAGIPASLKENAAAVYRLDKASLDINSASEYALNVHQVVTIMNEQGTHYLRHRLGFDKFYKVEDVAITMFDAQGVVKKRYTKKDFEVEAAYDGISLVTDDKVMSLYTPAGGYPCTMEVQYKIKASGYLELPDWTISTHDASTERFVYEVSVPEEIDIRHRTLNLSVTPVIEKVEKKKKYVWEVKNVAVKKLESEGYEVAKYLLRVEVAPNVFSYDGYFGSFKTWKDFGAWNYKLYEEKSPFSAVRIANIKTLLTNARDREEIIRLLYGYLQRNMRYVSIQLGIGGFKPFAVSFVDEKRYGDCKALTNYMRHLLMIAGIKSYPALINAGYNKLPADPSFPSDPFNHVILCIPAEKDTTWLECTSNTNKAGELGSFTENKKALLLTEDGGVLVSTPKSSHRNNQIVLQSLVSITAVGGAEVVSKIQSTGEAASLFQYIAQLNEDEQKEMLVKQLRFKQPEAFKLSAEKENKPALTVTTSFEKLYEFHSGNKFFFPLCVNKLGQDLKVAIRETDYLFHYPYEKSDTTVFQLPHNFTLETVPANKEIQTDYTSFKRSFAYDQTANKLVAISAITLKGNVIPAASYLKVAQFFKEVGELEEESFILVQKQVPGL